MSKKIVLLVTIFMTGAGSTYLLLNPNPNRQCVKALVHLKQKKYAEAEALLSSLSPSQQTLLYRGYLEQARGRLGNAERYLSAASHETKRGTPPALLAEISLAKASNAYLGGDDQEFSSLIEAACALNAPPPSLLFFQGLENYLHHAYAEALHLWGDYSADPMSGWMESTLDKLFPLSWRKLHIAHALIEEGDILAGRELLEKESHLSGNNPGHHSLTTLLLGLSYLKESHKVPFDQRGSYYKLACFYFDQAKIYSFNDDFFERESARVLSHIEEEAHSIFLSNLARISPTFSGNSHTLTPDLDRQGSEGMLIKHCPHYPDDQSQASERRFASKKCEKCGLEDEKSKWGFDFVHILQDWEAHDSVRRLSGLVTQKLIDQNGAEAIRICEFIRNDFLGTPFHLQLNEKMYSLLVHKLKRGETEDLFSLWSLVEQLSPNPMQAAKEIASLNFEEIFETIKKDNLLLTSTRNFIAFWEKLERSDHERERLAHDLFLHSKLFWHNEAQEKKGESLMEIALTLSDNHPFIEKEIVSFLTTLYTQAEESNMIQRLTLIYEAMEHFNINHQELTCKTTIANHLADAEYLYTERNYLAAQTHAEWVLKLDPYNGGAYRLAGLSAFHLGEYAKALDHLKELMNPDEDTYKALMLSYAFAYQEPGQELTNHLCQMNYLRLFGMDE